MLTPVSVGNKSLADYTHLAGRPLIQEIRDLAEDLEGLRVLHLSATAFGGGVSEILYALIPLMNDVGIAAEWQGEERMNLLPRYVEYLVAGYPRIARCLWPSSSRRYPIAPASTKDGSVVVKVSAVRGWTAGSASCSPFGG